VVSFLSFTGPFLLQVVSSVAGRSWAGFGQHIRTDWMKTHLVGPVVRGSGCDEAGGILVQHRHQLAQPAVLLAHRLLGRFAPLHPRPGEEM
jgi:hypothetical protein